MRETCVDKFLERARVCANDNAYFIKKNDQWQPSTWKEFGEDTTNFAKGLMSLGHEKGECVGVLGYNRPEWIMACIGTQMVAGVSAGVYTSCSAEEVAYVLHHSEAKVAVVENAKRWREQVKPVLNQLPHLKAVILMDNSEEVNDNMVMGFDKLLELGKKQDDASFKTRLSQIDPNGLATLIYTSGTTGPPKAVMLSHKSIAWTVDSTVNLIHVGKGDVILSYLPLAHIAEQMFSIYAPICCGATLYFAESMEKLPENLKEVQPTVFFGVPRVYEKFYAKVKVKIDSAKGTKKLLVTWAQKVAKEVWERKHQGKELSTQLKVQYAMTQKLIFSKLKPLLGLGRARICITGAAPISNDILNFFMGLDVPIYEVYGQSEDCGPTSINIPGAAKVGSVGKPLPGVKVKIADDGEILVKGPNVFMGYMKDEKATNEAMNDGWLFSGDIGHLDQDGYLKITDRKKDILITAGGKNIAPQNLEGMLKQIPLVSLAVVVGDRKKYLSALLTPNEENLAEAAKKMGIEDRSISNMVKQEQILLKLKEEIDKMNKKLAPVEQIKKFDFLPRDFSVETGELTPTMKIKRKVVNERYSKNIANLYQ
ncbi:long-chain fatty acid--CoA ligase [Sulfobacillus acidophilus]|uniref:Acyl-CoA synthetase n=1 Tax=Sulfobacillus acidophilus TaxID=53633 RepID=A0ABS3B0Q4_9FIRM|nr:long-chain fatty acid--CoA ligase [Sulfobacillus acidophilus]